MVTERERYADGLGAQLVEGRRMALKETARYNEPNKKYSRLQEKFKAMEFSQGADRRS